MQFFKYHALGNDYIVLNPADFPGWDAPSKAQIQTICHRNYGVGSDGILWGPLPHATASAGALRIFNPDGSEAEKSGNGLRIFCRYLWDKALVRDTHFTVATCAGVVDAWIRENGKSLSVDMGCVTFSSERIPVDGPPREVLNERLQAGDKEFTFSAASIGNPHCVIFQDEVSESLARRYGPAIESDLRFPNKTNVQFVKVLSRSEIQMEIWERGAGYTLASGSSSSAATAVAHRLGLVDNKVTVRMPGGKLLIELGQNFSVRMSGPVTRVAEGTMHPELLSCLL